MHPRFQSVAFETVETPGCSTVDTRESEPERYILDYEALRPERLYETAWSIPLKYRATHCTVTGNTAYQLTVFANAGNLSTPPWPLSTAATISRAASTGSRTGAKNWLGVRTQSNSGVAICPVSTSSVLILSLPRNSASIVRCSALSPALLAE